MIGSNGKDYFCIRLKNDNSSTNKSDGPFHELRNESDLYDVTLSSLSFPSGKYIQAHRLVLSASSPFFKNIFSPQDGSKIAKGDPAPTMVTKLYILRYNNNLF